VLESSACPEGAATATSNTAIIAEITAAEIRSFIVDSPIKWTGKKNGHGSETARPWKNVAANYSADLQARIFFENRR
jgi:hypothetical protein